MQRAIINDKNYSMICDGGDYKVNGTVRDSRLRLT